MSVRGLVLMGRYVYVSEVFGEGGRTVASAVGAAVTKEIWTSEVGSDLFRLGPEIIHRILLIRNDSSIRNQNCIDANSLTREWEGKSMVKNQCRIWILKYIQVPVCLTMSQFTLNIRNVRGEQKRLT